MEVYAAIKFRHFLEGKHFIVETDHHALGQLPLLTFKNGRLQRWSIRLSQFDYEVKYIKGVKHPADCLSRYQNEWQHLKLDDNHDEEDEARIFTVFQDPDEEQKKAFEFTNPMVTRLYESFVYQVSPFDQISDEVDLRLAQLEDTVCSRLISLLHDQLFLRLSKSASSRNSS